MKYAFIALITCYLLVVYGCGPDNSKKTEDKKGQAVHSSVEKPLQPEQPTQAVPAKETGKQPVAAAVDSRQPVQLATVPPSQPVAEVSQQPQVVEEQKADEVAIEQQQKPCKMMAARQGAVELTQPDEENIVVMPCGCMFEKHGVPTNAPCLKQQVPPCPMMGDKGPAAEEEDFIMMPCGRVFAMQPVPMDNPGLEPSRQTEASDQVAAQARIVEESEDDLATAVQKMAEATNDMVLVTKQLVVATQKAIDAMNQAVPKTLAPQQ